MPNTTPQTRKVTRLLLILLLMVFAPHHQLMSQNSESEPHEILRLGRGTANALAWRPDGAVLAVGGGTGVWLLDGDLQILLHNNQVDNVTWLEWSADGNILYALARNQQDQETYLSAWRMLTNPLRLDFAWESTEPIIAASLHPHRQEIITAGQNNQVRILNAVHGTVLEVLPFHGFSVVWSPDGNRLAVASSGKTPRIVDMNTQNSDIMLTDNNFVASTNFVWSPDGAFISTSCIDRSTMEFFNSCIWETTTGAFQNLSPNFLAESVWSNDGSWLVHYGAWFGVEQVGWMQAVDYPAERTTIQFSYPTAIKKLVFHPDGLRLTAIGFGDSIIEWDLLLAEIIHETDLFRIYTPPFTWSPDGAQLVSTSRSAKTYFSIWDMSNMTNADMDDPSQIYLVEGSPQNEGWFIPEVNEIRWHEPEAIHTIIEQIYTQMNPGRSRTYSVIQIDPIVQTLTTTAQFETGCQLSINYALNALACSTGFNLNIYPFGVDADTLHSLGLFTESGIVTGWSPDDNLLAILRSDNTSATGLNIELWNVSNQTKVFEYPLAISGYQPRTKNLVKWTADSSRFAFTTRVGDQDTLLVIDAQDFSEISRLPMANSGFDWHSNGQFIATIDSQGVTLWNAVDNFFISVAISGQFNDIRWSPSGNLLVLDAVDGTIRIWDMSALMGGS